MAGRVKGWFACSHVCGGREAVAEGGGWASVTQNCSGMREGGAHVLQRLLLTMMGMCVMVFGTRRGGQSSYLTAAGSVTQQQQQHITQQRSARTHWLQTVQCRGAV